MAFIPENAEWYVADIVIEIHAARQKDRRAWINTHLIHATSPEEALSKAEVLGKQQETSYLNVLGKKVLHTFRGVGDLQVVYDSLQDGTELTWCECTALTPDEVKGLIPSKADLAVFQPIEPDLDPNYAPMELYGSTQGGADGRKRSTGTEKR